MSPSHVQHRTDAFTIQLVFPQVGFYLNICTPAAQIRSRDVWLRELISNANDALEKFRLTSLTKKDFGNEDPLNITIKAVKDEDGKSGKIIVTGDCFFLKKKLHQAHQKQIPALE